MDKKCQLAEQIEAAQWMYGDQRGFGTYQLPRNYRKRMFCSHASNRQRVTVLTLHIEERFFVVCVL